MFSAIFTGIATVFPIRQAQYIPISPHKVLYDLPTPPGPYLVRRTLVLYPMYCQRIASPNRQSSTARESKEPIMNAWMFP
jgi:hypothetical protein